MTPPDRFRLLTRSDFDGLACAVLLKHRGLVGEVGFVHPKDMQDGKVAVTAHDITANLPYRPDVHLCFDHHVSEALRNEQPARNHVIDAAAPSAARVVWRHYGGHDAFPAAWDEMMDAVDAADSATFNPSEIFDPSGWTLLNFLMDARTGLGRFHHFRISNYQLMMDLIDHCAHRSIDEILALPDVAERIDMYQAHEDLCRIQLKRCATVHDDVVCLDLRSESTIYVANRFMVYAMFPGCRVSIHVLRGRMGQNTVFAVGKSIVNRGSPVNVGAMMLDYGGGGHDNAGTCQVDNDHAEATKQSLIARIVEEHMAWRRESA